MSYILGNKSNLKVNRYTPSVISTCLALPSNISIGCFSSSQGNDVKEDQFSDDSEWDDTIRSSDAIDDGNSTIVSSPKSKTAPDANLPQSTRASPPTSQLMKKFFPKLDTKEKVEQ